MRTEDTALYCLCYCVLCSITGMDLQFEVEDVEAFVKQPDGSVFSWCERFQCYCHLIYGMVSSCHSQLSFLLVKIHLDRI